MCWRLQVQWNGYAGTVVGIDGCVYGIPYNSKRVIKYSPANNDTTLFVGEEFDKAIQCTGGALGRDGCIYALATKGGRVWKIDTINNLHRFVGNRVKSDHDGE